MSEPSPPMVERVPLRLADARVTRVNGAIAVSRPGREHFMLNDTALALLELCDGTTTRDEMVVAACGLFATDERVILRDIDTLLDDLTSRGLIEWITISPVRSRQKPVTSQ